MTDGPTDHDAMTWTERNVDVRLSIPKIPFVRFSPSSSLSCSSPDRDLVSDGGRGVSSPRPKGERVLMYVARCRARTMQSPRNGRLYAATSFPCPANSNSCVAWRPRSFLLGDKTHFTQLSTVNDWSISNLWVSYTPVKKLHIYSRQVNKTVKRQG